MSAEIWLYNSAELTWGRMDGVPISGKGAGIFFFHRIQMAMEPTQCPIQWGSRALLPEGQNVAVQWFGSSQVKISARRLLIVTDIYRGFPQFLHTNAG
jgi:hypothetical protein